MARKQRSTKAAKATADGLTPVRTTFNPHEVIRVGDAELLDLTRQRLIYHGEDLAEPTPGEGEALTSGVITDAEDNDDEGTQS